MEAARSTNKKKADTNRERLPLPLVMQPDGASSKKQRKNGESLRSITSHTVYKEPLLGGCAEHKQKTKNKKRRASPLNSSDAAGRSERSTRRASDSVISQGFTPSPLGSAPSPMGPTPSPLWQHHRNPRHRLWGQCHRLRDGAIASGPSPPAGSARSPQGAAPSLLRPAPSLLGPAATNKTCK